MKIRIHHKGWRVDRRTGESRDMEIQTEDYPLALGPVGAMAPQGRRIFTVTAIDGDKVTIDVGLGKTVTASKERPGEFRPISFGGGHYYVFEIID